MISTRPTSTHSALHRRVAKVAKPLHRVRQWELVEFAAQGSLARIYRARPVSATLTTVLQRSRHVSSPSRRSVAINSVLPAEQPPSYAIKMLRRCWEDSAAAVRLLQREAAVGQSVAHPHLVPVLSAYVLEAPHLLVMPWLEGASLERRLAAGQQFSVAKTLWIARQTTEALDALHQAGWTHGDVTPGNIHVSPSGHVTLIDLNFARRHDEIGSAVDRPIMGTCSYIAPEHLTSALRPDIRSDVYSLGVVMFEMLSGNLPYQSKELAALATEHRQSAPADLTQLASHVPREVVALVRQMLAHDPLRRPQSLPELISWLVSLEIDSLVQRAG
jgi:eukaryotic-like serine/threonine-protein kinase